ncbi:IKZF [Mytilus edulis]|uniref:IKZF n=1 Tax=Mytilus edulis TaxID=6550 RepID=A0A8S3R2K9_MYTED|nr:IKZF [Mytilus edulis]
MTLVDTYLKANVSSADQFTYKIFQQNALQYMINTEMKNHMLYKQDCKGDLKFDTEAQVKWGLAWQERFQCNICGFKSAFHKLYEEVESLKRGRRAATVNIGAQVGLIHTPISNKNFSEILNAANIISPSSSGLQKCANKVSKVVEKVNKDDMENIRKNLANDNKTLGLSNEKLVRVESDARNFPGRAHAAVLMVNNKYSNSVIKLSVQLGAAITPGSLVAKQLKQRHKIDIRNAQRKRLISSKLRRANSRRRKYKLHASIHYPLSVYYKKGLADSGNEDCDNICD